MHILTYLSGIPVEHPAWCNPLTCRIDNEADGGVFVTHQLTLLDDGDRLVDIGQCGSITADGVLVKRGVPDVAEGGGRILTVDAAAALGAALVAAAEAVRGGAA